MKKLILICTILLSIHTVFAQTFLADGINYNITSATEPYTVEVVSKIPNYYEGDIIIPEQVTYNNITYAVTSIGDYAFSACGSLLSIVIPNSVTSIGECAFVNCISLKSIEIPNSVTSIEKGVFSACSSLSSIVIPNSVTDIGEWAFSSCRDLKSIEIPNSVTSIGSRAFASCSYLSSIVIPNSVISIGNSAFYDCNSLTSIVIPNSVTSIGELAFDFCTNLASIIIPNSVTSIGDYAFWRCSSLTSIEIPNSITSIGDGVFSNCYRLSSIVIPNSVTSIGDDAFYYCASLTSIISYCEIPPSLGIDVFLNVPKNIPLYVPYTSINLYKQTEQWKDFIIRALPIIGSGDIRVSGTVFFDENANGIQDVEEYGLQQQTLLILPDSVYVQTDNDGNYYFSCGAGTYQIIPLLYDNWELTSAPMHDVTVTLSDTSGIDFGIQGIEEEKHTEISLTSLDGGRCFESVPFYITFKNNGTVLEQGRIQFNPDSQLEGVLSTTPNYDSISVDSKILFWNMSDVRPFEERKILLDVQMPDFTTMGDTLVSIVTYKDAASVQNSDTAKVLVRCSYDPNDKQVYPAGMYEENFVLMSDPLLYTIRFQNTGNDVAKNIVIIDTLSSFLNLKTFEVVATSHNLQTRYTHTGVVEFRFDAIMLVDSTTNEPQSHGFVKYRIKTKSGLPDNTKVENTAYIFFDYNPAIVTNTTMNTMTYTIPKRGETYITIPYKETVKIYPNPFSTSAVLEFYNSNNDMHQLTISDISGKIVYTKHSNSSSFIIEKGTMQKGVYMYILTNTKTEQMYRDSFVIE